MSLKKRTFLLVIVLMIAQIVLTVFLCLHLFQNADSSLIDYNVVIDAGHGGVDGGVTVSGVKESDLNLEYARCLGGIFCDCGFGVTQTRSNVGGLYGLYSKGFKRRDMEKRRKIISESQPNLVISLHMNKFADTRRFGPQVFYQSGSEEGKLLADNVQNVLNAFTGNSHEAIAGDYFICRTSSCPSIIVECGFLSNENELLRLQESSYREQLCQKIYEGVMLYLYTVGN